MLHTGLRHLLHQTLYGDWRAKTQSPLDNSTKLSTTGYVDAAIAAASGFGGGSMTHSYIGYNTAGGTTETMTTRRVYATKVTLATAGLITSIGAYCKSDGADHVGGLAVGVFSDNSGTPNLLIAKSPVVNTDSFLETAAATTTARWLHVPLGFYLTAGDYWLAVGDMGANPNVIHKDGSGADRYYTSGGNWIADWGFYTPTTTTSKYSIRADFIS